MFICKYCKGQFGNIKLLIKHTKKFHSSASNLKIICGRSGCLKIFKSFGARWTHISRNHNAHNISNNEFSEMEVDTSVEYENLNIFSTDAQNESFAEVTEFPDQTEFENSSFSSKSNSNKKEFSEAQFVLSLRAKGVSQPIVEKVLENAEIAVRACVEDFCDEVNKALREKGIILEEIMDITKAIDRSSTVFSNVNTKYKQDSYFNKYMFVVEPKKYILSKQIIEDGQAKIGENRSLKLKDEVLIYVSLIDIVENLLLKENYKKLLRTDSTPKDDDILYSFLDGSFIKNNELLATHG